jgi:NADPH-dependent F420 reductase
LQRTLDSTRGDSVTSRANAQRSQRRNANERAKLENKHGFEEVSMRIAVVGGTGNEGRGMALRWARAGHEVFIGSRTVERAQAAAAELNAQAQVAIQSQIQGNENEAVVRACELVVLSVPYTAHASTLAELKEALVGRILIDITVPLKPPKVTAVNLPAGQAAALEAQQFLGEGTQVVAALHHVSAVHLRDLDHAIDCDVLACSDHKEALERVLPVIRDLGVRAFDAGPLLNAIALESLTPILLHMNRSLKGRSVGIRITGA